MLQALNDYKKTAEQATAMLEPKRETLHLAATTTRDQLAEQISVNKQREVFVEIIEQAISGVDESQLTSAPMTVQQFVTSQIKHPEALAGNGRTVLEVFYDAAKGMPAQTMQRALESVLLAATGAVTVGLYRWPQPWHARLPLDTLSKFAKDMDEAAHRQHTDTLAKLKADHTTASLYAERFADCVTITPLAYESKPKDVLKTVAVINRAEGTPLVCGDVRFSGHGGTTWLTQKELEQVAQSPVWKTGIATGVLEVLQ